MRPNGNHGGGNNFNRRPRNNNQGGGGNRSGGNQGGGNNIRRPQQPTNLRNQIFDSHGPNGERVRGNAFQVHEKYQSLARDAEERVDQEAYGQHAEHYYRIVEAIQEMEAERNARFGNQNQPNGEAQSRPQDNSQPRGDYNGDQPDLNASAEGGEGENGESQQQRRSFTQNNNRRPQRDQQPRDQQPRDQQPRDQQPRDQQQRDQQPRDEQGDDAQEEPRPRRQPRAPMQERAPLEPISTRDESDDNSGPSFSLADEPIAEAAPAKEVAPRRRGRPAAATTPDAE